MGYLLKEALKTLCGVNQWSYAIFWKIGLQNPKLLIWEECYYEPVIYGGNKVHLLVTKMMKDNYINILGEGLVGRVAFTQNHQWVISDNKSLGVHAPGVSNEVYTQFSAGIQTIAVIPVHPHGVVQLGSSSTIMENVGFVNDVKSLISQLGCVPGALLSQNISVSPHSSGKSQVTDSTLIHRASLYDQGPKSNQQIGFGSFNQTMTSNNVVYDPPSLSDAHFSCTHVDKGKLEHELFQALSMSSQEQHLKPPSRDDLFDIVGMDFKTKLFNGNPNNSINNRVEVEPNPLNNTVYDCKSNSGVYSSIPNDHLLDAVVSKVHPSYSYKSMEDVGRFSDNSSIISSQIGSWNDVRIEPVYGKKGDEIGKSNRKRLKPGENPRPRPKDRQMIQDRVKELREIVPNGAKCSIDALLERTIKHMLFLQSVRKHADKLKQTGESKIASKEGGVLLRDNFEGGATWAYEVGSESMVCPIIVEDLNSPRQMLVEMVCEERDSFLEIADVIKGLGLTILKGVMEYRNHKIWAHFTLEANRDVTRMEIFISLVSLLDQSAKNRESLGDVRVPCGSEMLRAALLQ